MLEKGQQEQFQRVSKHVLFPSSSQLKLRLIGMCYALNLYIQISQVEKITALVLTHPVGAYCFSYTVSC